MLPPVLGVVLAPPHVAAKLRAAVGLEPADGALVRGLDPEGAAARAGVREGDLIVGVRSADAAGQTASNVDGPDSLQAALERLGPAEELVLLVLRGTDRQEITVRFDAPAAPDESADDTGAEDEAG